MCEWTAEDSGDVLVRGNRIVVYGVMYRFGKDHPHFVWVKDDTNAVNGSLPEDPVQFQKDLKRNSKTKQSAVKQPKIEEP